MRRLEARGEVERDVGWSGRVHWHRAHSKPVEADVAVIVAEMEMMQATTTTDRGAE
jgi:hypothetical protein